MLLVMPRRFVLLSLFLLLAGPRPARAWGFFGHRLLNRLAVYTLPPAMIGFYKAHIEYLTVNATRPDARRTVMPGEAARHFLDVDRYGDSCLSTHGRGLPRRYEDAVARLGEDSLLRHGIVPWSIAMMKNRLTAAFQRQDADAILRLSADLGHYVADACVPLHTTKNYNGQLTGQRGIHALWESRLPELLAANYDLFAGPAPYLDHPGDAAWAAVARSHAAVDSVLSFEKEVTGKFPEDRKYGFEARGAVTARVYSRDFSRAYHARLGGQVERQLRYASRLIGAFWYTCWVDAGAPDLSKLPRTTSAVEELRLVREAADVAAAPAAGAVPGHEE